MLSLSIDLEERNAGDAELTSVLYEAHREAEGPLQRLRLVAASREIQESGRHVLRYAYGRLRQAEGKPLRRKNASEGR